MRSFTALVGNGLFSVHPNLRVRSSMALLAVLLMLGSAGIMLWLGYAGYGQWSHMVWWSAFAVGGLLVMALMVRSGMTASWSDPALTLPQILWGITANATAYVLAGEAKGVVQGLLAVTLLFAALNLSAKNIVAVSLYALGAYAVAVLLVLNFKHGAQVGIEMAYAASLVLVLAGCMLLNLRLHQLRARLRQQRKALAAALEENRELASRDTLTGLLNRRHMLELLHLEQRRCLRGVRNMLLAQMDIDHFKAINDTYGHGVGDLALKAFTEQVRAHIRSSDVFSRWGGEEFVLLLGDIDVEGALMTLQRVRQAVQHATVAGAPDGLRMTVSIGLAEHMTGESIEVTLERADQALYRAKRGGRNQVVWAAHQRAATATEPEMDTAQVSDPKETQKK